MQAVKKGAAQSGSPTTPTQDGQGEKVVKSRWQPRNSCDGRSLAISLIKTIQVNLCCHIPASLGVSPKLTLLNLLPKTDHHSHFLAATWISQLFYPGHLV